MALRFMLQAGSVYVFACYKQPDRASKVKLPVLKKPTQWATKRRRPAAVAAA